MFAEKISYSAAFLAGLFSFFSPCVLPLIPAYFTFITGYSLEDFAGDIRTRVKVKVILSTLAFVAGFSLVFILMGASASVIGNLINQYRDVIRIAGGVMIVLLGIHMTGLLKIKLLEIEKRLQLKQKPVHFLGTFIIGMAFAGGWSPCIGPLLGSILIIAGSKESIGEGMLLLSVYSAGLAMPFLLISMFIHLMLAFIRKFAGSLKYMHMTAGGLLILVGLLLITDKLVFLTKFTGS